MAERRPCRRCRQVRLSGFIIAVALLLGYALLKISG